MADEKKTKTVESKPKEKPVVEKGKVEAPAEAKTDAPKNYSRGEGQKAVTKEYKDNWNAIFGKKKKR